jgi:fatty acid desaturase
MLGNSNIDAGPAMAFMTGNLSYQIEHHLYRILPSNRLAEISVRVRQVCDKYDLPCRGQLLNGALRRVQAVASSARVTRHGLKDTVSRIWITRFVQTGPDAIAGRSDDE